MEEEWECFSWILPVWMDYVSVSRSSSQSFHPCQPLNVISSSIILFASLTWKIFLDLTWFSDLQPFVVTFPMIFVENYVRFLFMTFRGLSRSSLTNDLNIYAFVIKVNKYPNFFTFVSFAIASGERCWKLCSFEIVDNYETSKKCDGHSDPDYWNYQTKFNEISIFLVSLNDFIANRNFYPWHFFLLSLIFVHFISYDVYAKLSIIQKRQKMCWTF